VNVNHGRVSDFRHPPVFLLFTELSKGLGIGRCAGLDFTGGNRENGEYCLLCLIVEVKAVEKVHPINKAQLLSYMKLLDIPLGLIINFNVLKLTDGVSRLILPGANDE